MTRASTPPAHRPHVAHLVNSFLPVTQNWVYNQIAFNKECDHTVLCQRRENAAAFPWDDVHVLHPVEHLGARMRMLVEHVLARYPQRQFRAAVTRAHAGVLHGHLASESVRNLGLARFTGLPLVTTFYGVDGNKLWRRPWWKRRYARLFRTGAAFMAEGEHMASCIRAMGCPAAKLHVVRLGVDLDGLPTVRREPQDPAIRVMFVGLSREKKGPLDAAAAFGRVAFQLPKLELHVIGDGCYREGVEQLVRFGGVRDRTVFHGMLSVDKYREVLGQCHICLAPSVTARDGDTEGGAPVTVIEAMACGMPIVGTTHCDIPNIAPHGTCGLLCEERDVSALAANLRTLAGDATLRARMGEAARQRARSEHDIRTQVRKITEVYRSVSGLSQREDA